jgi:N-acetylglucosamine-6-phosphate deacetylase
MDIMKMKLRGDSYRTNNPIEVVISDGRIESIVADASQPENSFLIGPGFTDLQVNGYGGLDYNEIQNDPIRLASISCMLYKEGVTTHFPTIITNSEDQITNLIKQVVNVREQDEKAKWSIEGIHIEGPFISPTDGPRGAHPKEFVRSPDWTMMQRWLEAGNGLIRIITLSPECEGTNPFIEQCVKNNILVFIGHTNATHQQLLDAVSAGATLSTHLGNGMHPVIDRHHNYLWSQLSDDRLGASIIADGFHLPPEVIHVFHKVKKEKLLLVSDSVSLAGMPPGDYDLHIGGQVTLTTEGRLHLRNNPSIFAGSACNIKQGVSFLIKNGLTTLDEAWDMASVRPWLVVNPSAMVFESGSAADLVVLRKLDGGEVEIRKTIKGGVEVFKM